MKFLVKKKIDIKTSKLKGKRTYYILIIPINVNNRRIVWIFFHGASTCPNFGTFGKGYITRCEITE